MAWSGRAVAAAAAAALVWAAPASADRYTLVSPAPGGAGNAHSFSPVASHDGSVVAFTSEASNLVPDDGNGACDVFVRAGGTTQRVSVSSSGGESRGSSCEGPALSGDGRLVAFSSEAPDLVPGDANGRLDVFVHDRETGETRRVSVGPDGEEADGPSLRPAISADGRYVAFDSGARNLNATGTGYGQVHVRDLVTGAGEVLSLDLDGQPTQGNASAPSLSADGRFVAFSSDDGNLVPGDDNLIRDVFVRDRTTGVTERVSLRSDGSQSDDIFAQPLGSFDPHISADGRFVAFESAAQDLVLGDRNNLRDAFRHDRETGATRAISIGANGLPRGGHSPKLSGGGTLVVFHAVHGAYPHFPTDVFLHEDGLDRPFAVTPGRFEGDFSSHATLSGDGGRVVFGSQLPLAERDGNGLIDVYSAPPTPVPPPPPPPPPPDEIPPLLSVPGPIGEHATSPDGADVEFVVTASDETDPSPAVTCSHASGSRFPIGTKWVSCTATDASGNSASAGFGVRVLGAVAQIAVLREQVLGEPEIGPRYRRGLLGRLDLAARTAERRKGARLACRSLEAFEQGVARRDGGRLAAETAEHWTAAARRVRAVLACA